MYIKKILWVIALVGLAVAAYLAYYVYSAMLSPNTAFNNEEAFIFIQTDADYQDVRGQLEPLLGDIETFDALAQRKQYTANIKAGKYRIVKGMNNNEIINSIRSKNIPITVSFNNQNTIGELAGRIGQQIEADSLSLISSILNSEFLESNGFESQTAIAMYLPNSYEFFWNTDADGFRDRMKKEYDKFWTDDRMAMAEEIGLSPVEVMTLASIVYEESKKADEQPIVAGVYINRLKRGIALQADPTLKFAAYQLPEYKNTVIKRVLNVHKEINSPYNTYMYPGLPPGPIAMPDLSAIKAVLNYQKHNYLYFSADPERLGYHKFATTLAQHNANARAYHAYLNSQGIKK
ncbi:endolytic transglycosylase MltG [Aegicerativicinus sediminis]|uniref:endolytic transglycosylase MltG n=1 Tax=Aegicerativicinus sediminis TaxID=2893202 RepID=UPI001E2CD0E6|nr:endolytic transglycosylase MltG [Aegicerativicinus sediminis]